MAVAAVQTAMNLEQKKNIHPFFSKPHGNTSPERRSLENEARADITNNDPDGQQQDPDTTTAKGRRKRTRKSDGERDKEGGFGKKSQASLERFTQRSGVQDDTGGTAGNEVDISEVLALEEDPNKDRQKRRKTDSPRRIWGKSDQIAQASMPENRNWHQQLQIEAQKDTSYETAGLSFDVQAIRTVPNSHDTNGVDALPCPSTPSTLSAEDGPRVSAIPTTSTAAPEDKSNKKTPTKVLKVNKNGKLLSSPPAKPGPEMSNSPKKRRSRKATKAKVLPTITIIKYGADAQSRRDIGQEIERILSGTKPATHPATLKKTTPKPAGPVKPTHPFFLGKVAVIQDDEHTAQPVADSHPPSPRTLKKSAVTPGKLRAETRREQLPPPMPSFGPIGRQSRNTKHAGLNEASWPSKENAHVRNLGTEYNLEQWRRASFGEPTFRPRKMKNNVLVVPHDEDLMTRLSQQLSSEVHKKVDPKSSDFEPPEDVRLPIRLLTTGVDIQDQVRSQVRSELRAHEEQKSRKHSTHPAINSVFSDIRHNLTAFDQGKCESQSWVQKYAPKNAAHVLQAGKEARILYDWLKGLTVIAVEGSKDAHKAEILSELKKPPKKKRKRAEDDFIVSEDESEDEEMIELSDTEPYSQTDVGPPRMRSFRRPRITRSKNVILISGPNGCGKSATVYAVAKELEFEVFEINPGSRRSGRDIQDKVGDMTENHLVNHKRNEISTKQDIIPDEDTDNERMSNSLQKDLASGRQGTMTSFFTSNSTAKAKPKKQELNKAPTSSTQATLHTAQFQRKSQKQSLILFEEADILFEEDQQFWAQVTRLASQSKRPIVITCNDENLIPVHDLPLGAILRLSPPPVDLATDYMLVLAGREGHILEREAVSAMYKSKNYDLRASITELNLWCQMSVGDRKGGLEWIYQRWPPGKDVDEHGRLLRVASKETYRPGMGWLSHNIFKSLDNVAFEKREELLKESWVGWGISPTQWSDRRSSVEEIQKAPQESSAISLGDLKRLESLCDSISAADIYCRIGIPSYDSYFDEPTDPTLPSLPEKERLNYTLAAPVIQVDHVSDFHSLDTSIFSQIHLLVQRTSNNPTVFVSEVESKDAMPKTEADFATAILAHKEEKSKDKSLIWPDFSLAFDILAAPPGSVSSLSTSYNLTPSSFDYTFRIVTLDLAPYVRSIVSHELVLEAERIRLGNLLSEGGRGKRARTTRASRTAMEGGKRETKRRERWFDKDLNFELVMDTAGRSWTGMGSGIEYRTEDSVSAGDTQGTQESLTGSQRHLMVIHEE